MEYILESKNSTASKLYAFFKNVYIAILMSFYEIKTRYRRTVIGPLWITLGTAITTLGMGVVWSSIFGIKISEFLPYVATGMVIWIYISSILNEGCSVFTAHSSIIHNVKTSYVLCISAIISKNLIIMFHNMIVVALIFIICGQPINFEILWVFPGLLLLILNSFWVSIFLGIFSTRYRDVTAIVASLTALIMIVTPILWKEDMLQGNRQFIARINPFAHMINIIREPLLGKAPSLESYVFIMGILAITLPLSVFLFKKFKHRIVFWM